MIKPYKYILIVALALTGLIVIVAILASPAVKWAVLKVLSSEYQNATVKKVSANIFTGRITLNGIEASNPNTGRFAIEKADIDMDLTGALSRHIRVALLSVSDAEIDVIQNQDGSWAIAGLVPVGEDGHPEPNGKQQSKWSWSLEKIDLNDLRLSVVGRKINKQSLLTGEEPAMVTSESDEMTTPRSVKASLHGTFFYNGSASYGDGHDLSVEGVLKGRDLVATLHLDNDDILVSGDELTYAGLLRYEKDGAPGADGTFSLSSLHFKQGGTDRSLLDVEAFEISNIIISGTDTMTADSAAISGIRFFEYAPEHVDSTPPLSRALDVSEVQVIGLALSDLKRFEINSVDVKDMGAFLVFSVDGKFEPLTSLIRLGSRRGVYEEKEYDKKDLRLVIGKVALRGNNGIIIKDLSTSPHFRTELASLEADFGWLDTSGEGKPLRIRISSGVGKTGTLKIQGQIRLFSQKLDSELTAEILDLNLPDFNPYLGRQFSYIVRSGRADIRNIAVNIDNDNLDTRMDVSLKKLDLKREGGGILDADKVLGMPVRTAISMITDTDGVVRLDVAVEGSLDDPQFEVDEVLRKAVLNALKKGAVSYFSPIGVQLLTGLALPAGALGAVMKFYDIATAVRFEPVYFVPGKTALSDEQRKHLDLMADLLKKRPEVNLVLCGIAVPADSLSDGQAVEEQDSEASGVETADQEWTRERLLDLATERTEAVTVYLVSRGIARKRLFTCTSEISDNDEDRPRVEVGI